MSTTLTIGTRGSELALRQTELVEEQLSSTSPGLSLNRRIIRTLGDERTDVPLPAVAAASGIIDKGVFIKEIEQALAEGTIDCAVHSLKDMPGELDPRFELAAVLPRADIHDVLILKQGCDINSLCLGTSSVRRIELAKAYWGGTARCRDLRGNVPTRLRKLAADPELDGIIIARAGLTRLGYTSPTFTIDGATLTVHDLPRDSFPPAVGQGIIAIEARKGDRRVLDILAPLNHADTMTCARTEREFLRLLGADCSTPVGAYARIVEQTIVLRVLHISPHGIPRRIVARGPQNDPESVAALAIKLLADLRH